MEISPLEPIKVAVRLRPFTKSEKEAKLKSIITIDNSNNQCHIVNPSTNEKKIFTFDFVYDSAVDPSDPNYASQEVIWKDIGKELLDACMSGYNYTCFLTGQTGSGKSHTMLGFGETPECKGILPRACDGLFERIRAFKSYEREVNIAPKAADQDVAINDSRFKIQVSMLEIYNEKIRDLFVPLSKHERSGLKIRSNPKTGAYVEKLKKIRVESVEQIRRLIDFGTKNRTIAATNMNEISSRAHTIFTIICIKTVFNKATMKVTSQTSLINLVDVSIGFIQGSLPDHLNISYAKFISVYLFEPLYNIKLAGSERVGRTGAVGDRLKEGGHINKSLSALGNVINALAMNSTKNKGALVPYRSSLLTHLLKSSLGGNAKTTIIAAISPTCFNYKESLSSLRFVDRAKHIQNVAIINEDPNDRLIRELKEEMRMLRKQVEKKPDLDAQEREIIKNEMEIMFKRKLDLEKAQWERAQKERETCLRHFCGTQKVTQLPPDSPFLSNLNENFSFCGVFKHYLQGSEMIIGSERDKTQKRYVVICGIGIKPNHARVSIMQNNYDGQMKKAIFISTFEGARTLLNGKILHNCNEKIELKHNDRIIFGYSNAYKVVLPNEEKQTSLFVDWEMAMKEANATITDKIEEGCDQKSEMEKKIKNLEMELEKNYMKLVEEEERKEKMVAEHKSLEEQLHQQILQNKKIQRSKEQKRKPKAAIDRQLLHAIQLVREANYIYSKVGKNKKFRAKLVRKGGRSFISNDDKSEFLMKVCVAITTCSKDENKNAKIELRNDRCCQRTSMTLLESVDDWILETEQIWSFEKFHSRIFSMREMYRCWLNNDFNLNTNKFDNFVTDPFHDVPNEIMIGVTRYNLEALYYMLDIDDRSPIIDCSGKRAGELSISILSMVLHGVVERNKISELIELSGNQIRVVINVKGAIGLHSKFVRDYSSVFVRWQFFHGEWRKSPLHPLTNRNPTISFEKYSDVVISNDLCAFVKSETIDIEVWCTNRFYHNPIKTKVINLT